MFYAALRVACHVGAVLLGMGSVIKAADPAVFLQRDLLTVRQSDGCALPCRPWQGGAFEDAVARKDEIFAAKSVKDRHPDRIKDVVYDTNVFVIGPLLLGLWHHGADADDPVAELINR